MKKNTNPEIPDFKPLNQTRVNFFDETPHDELGIEIKGKLVSTINEFIIPIGNGGFIKDRRKNDKGESTRNRQKFLRRVNEQIKQAIPEVVSSNNIDTLTNSKQSIKIPIKGLREPSFAYNRYIGKIETTLNGNELFERGDLIPKPEGNGNGSGKGNKSRRGSKDGGGEDDFVISISKDEFLKYFFDDLELPDLIKTNMANVKMVKKERAGYKTYGNPSQLNKVESFKKAMGRNIAMTSIYEEEIKKLELKISKTKNKEEKNKLLLELEELKKTAQSVPFFDPVDLRYNAVKIVNRPVTCAVMFCIMDISGSMGAKEKDLAKRFFTLLYMFLNKEYERVDIVFIQHHTEAKEVSEEEFFNSRESGGTVVLPAIKLASKILRERYLGEEWNAYACQISDGDTSGLDDALNSHDELAKNFLPHLQYMAYIEVCPNRQKGEEKSLLWKAYSKSAKDNAYFDLRTIRKISDIWQTFRKIFLKKEFKDKEK